MKKKITRDDKKQLLLYQMAIQDIFDIPVKKLTYHYLEDNSKVSFIGTEKQLDDLKNEIIEQVSKIKISNFNPKPGFHCKFCDFSDICEFRQK